MSGMQAPGYTSLKVILTDTTQPLRTGPQVGLPRSITHFRPDIERGDRRA